MGDVWESFLFVVFFWVVVFYGDFFVCVIGFLILVLIFIMGMYGWWFSLLSSSGWSEFGFGVGDSMGVVIDVKGVKMLKKSKSKNLLVDGLLEKNIKIENGIVVIFMVGYKRN